MGKGDRPENCAPPEIFYNEDEARKYTDNTRILTIQTTLTERALELLALPDDGEPKLLLDLGCGSGLSGETLSERGHVWLVSRVRLALGCRGVPPLEGLLRVPLLALRAAGLNHRCVLPLPSPPLPSAAAAGPGHQPGHAG